MYVLSVVIPAYNEEESIASVVRGVDTVADVLRMNNTEISEVEILVVNDGSTDQTEERAMVSSRVRVINHQKNQGYGAALKTGFLNSKGNLIAFLDADGTYPPEYLGALCAPIIQGYADMTVGARNRAGQSGMPFVRRVGNLLFAGVLTWIAETPVIDSASGMRVLPKSILLRLLPLPDGMDFIVGLSTRALHEGLRVLEIPIGYAERAGRSKLNVTKDGVRFLGTLMKVAVTYNPLKFFGLLGLLSLVLACYLGMGPVIFYMQYRRVEDWEIYRLMTILVLGIVGFQLINFGIIGNRLLALMTGSHFERRSLFGRLLLDRGLFQTTWKVGAALCIGAVVLNHTTIVQYLTLRSVYVHWSYIVTGATAFLVGAQLLMTWGVLVIFEKVEQRRAYLKALRVQEEGDRIEVGGQRLGSGV